MGKAGIALGFLVATIFWIAVLGWQAAYAPTDQQKNDCYEAAKKAGHQIEQCKTFWEKATTDPLTVFTLVLAVSTVGLWIATAGLYFAGEKQMRLMRENADRQSTDMQASVAVAGRAAEAAKQSADIAERALMTTERAFVFVLELTPDFTVYPRANMVGFGRFRVLPLWRNSGNTPTKDMRIAISWKDVEGELPDDFEYTYDCEPLPMFLAPQAQEWSAAITIDATIASNALNEKTNIFIWGRVDYRDIFENTPQHFTEWCYRVVFTKSPKIEAQFLAFGQYNRSDEDGRTKSST